MRHLKIYMAALFSLVAAVAFNSVAGASISVAMDGSALTGALAGNTIALVAGSFMPKGSLLDGVFTEIWTGEMIKAFRTAAESLGWYDRIKNYDQYVDNDVIHFTEIGGDLTVLVNNTTYPLEIETLEDADKSVPLDKFDTTATPVTDDELHACSYDKMRSVQERHRDVLREKVCEKSIHAIAPTKKADDTPVLLTTGETLEDGTRKKMTFADLLAAKKACDKLKMPKSDRILVLCSDHANDLLETEQKFKDTITSTRRRAR